MLHPLTPRPMLYPLMLPNALPPTITPLYSHTRLIPSSNAPPLMLPNALPPTITPLFSHTRLIPSSNALPPNAPPPHSSNAMLHSPLPPPFLTLSPPSLCHPCPPPRSILHHNHTPFLTHSANSIVQRLHSHTPLAQCSTLLTPLPTLSTTSHLPPLFSTLPSPSLHPYTLIQSLPPLLLRLPPIAMLHLSMLHPLQYAHPLHCLIFCNAPPSSYTLSITLSPP